EKFVRIQDIEELISGVDGAAVAPDDGRSEHFALGIDDHQTVHLVRQSDSLDRMLGFGVFAYQFLAAFADVLPPLVGVLFGESRLRGIDGHFGGWGRNDLYGFTR